MGHWPPALVPRSVVDPHVGVSLESAPRPATLVRCPGSEKSD
jgi:hypothetical protein